MSDASDRDLILVMLANQAALLGAVATLVQEPLAQQLFEQADRIAKAVQAESGDTP